jgi:PPOX class probable F420-dependent enzyme
MRLSPTVTAFVRAARIAHLATADAYGQPHVIPICFVFDGNCFYSPIDEKPKRTAIQQLKRIRNIRGNPKIALILDHYEEDWRNLAYLLVFGKARILLSGDKHRQAVRLLRRKYPQYRRMSVDKRPMISITPRSIVVWGRMQSEARLSADPKSFH